MTGHSSGCLLVSFFSEEKMCGIVLHVGNSCEAQTDILKMLRKKCDDDGTDFLLFFPQLEAFLFFRLVFVPNDGINISYWLSRKITGSKACLNIIKITCNTLLFYRAAEVSFLKLFYFFGSEKLVISILTFFKFCRQNNNQLTKKRLIR